MIHRIVSSMRESLTAKAAVVSLLVFGCLVPSHRLLGDEPSQRVLRIGFLSQSSAADTQSLSIAFRDRLKELGYRVGKDIVIEPRWADGDVTRLPALAAQLVDLKVDIVVTGGTPGALAAKNATESIPIIATGMADPIRAGLAASLSHPGGNLTGMSMGFTEELGGKWLELLKEAVPRLTTVAIITNPDNPIHQYLRKDIEAAAPKMHLKLYPIEVRTSQALSGAFATARKKSQAILLIADAVTLGHKSEIVELANTQRIPVIYNIGTFVDRGGLMSYAPDLQAQARRAAELVDKVAKGAHPSDLPIEQPNKYELAVNLQTARRLGLTIPESVLVRADRVIR